MPSRVAGILVAATVFSTPCLDRWGELGGGGACLMTNQMRWATVAQARMAMRPSATGRARGTPRSWRARPRTMMIRRSVRGASPFEAEADGLGPGPRVTDRERPLSASTASMTGVNGVLVALSR